MGIKTLGLDSSPFVHEFAKHEAGRDWLVRELRNNRDRIRALRALPVMAPGVQAQLALLTTERSHLKVRLATCHEKIVCLLSDDSPST